MCVGLPGPGALAADPDPTDKGKTDPPGVPLAALYEQRASYNLDLGGKTADEVRKRIASGDYPLRRPSISASTSRNTGDKDLLIRINGTTTIIDLDLQGPAASELGFKGRAVDIWPSRPHDGHPGARQEPDDPD